MSKQNYAVCCYTCENNGQETCKGCNTILNGENGPYENWQLREDLCRKDKQIVELQKQLEEKEKLIEKLQGVIDKLRDKKFAGKTLVEAVNAVYEPLFKNKCDEVEEIKQQLKSQPAEIVENIKKKIEKEKDKNDLAWLGFNKLDRILDEILQEYQKVEN